MFVLPGYYYVDLFLVVPFLWPACLSSSIKLQECPCDDINLCKPLVKTEDTKFKIYAFSNGTTDIEKWNWETITTFVAPSAFRMENKLEYNTMCTVHKYGKKFGITANMDLSGPLNFTSMEAQKWIGDVVLEYNKWNADVINIDLLSYFKSNRDSVHEDYIGLANIINGLSQKVNKIEGRKLPVDVTCVVPWKPPCASKDIYCDFSGLIAYGCDYIVISPDSFLDVKDEKCRAHAIIPISKLRYGVSEYTAHSIPTSRIILGVSWHGYDYTCVDLHNDVCSMKTTKENNSTVTKCDMTDRKKITYTAIIKDHPKEAEVHILTELDYAPFFNYKDGPIHHQIWFEDHKSLLGKYRLVKQVPMAGVAIMYGDDLDTSQKSSSSHSILWSWISHAFLVSKAQEEEEEKEGGFHCADTVAGYAVGFLLLGCFLGLLIACIIRYYRRNRKPEHVLLGSIDTMTYNEEHANGETRH